MMWVDYNITQAGDHFKVEGDWPGEVMGWTRDGEIDFSKAPKLKRGEWRTKEWKGAVLSVSTLTNQSEELNNFCHQSFTFLKEQIQST